MLAEYLPPIAQRLCNICLYPEHRERARLLSVGVDVDNGFVAKAYPVRWFVLVVLALQMALGNLSLTTVNPIADITACYYGVSLWWINALSGVFALSYVVLFFAGTWFLATFGLRTTLVVGSCISSAGAWIRFAGAGIQV